MTSMLVLALGLVSFHALSGPEASTPPSAILPPNPLAEASVPTGKTPRTATAATSGACASTVAATIRIMAGNRALYAAMKDNRTAREFIELLPLRLRTFDRIGLVKSTILPHSISDDAERTRKYSIGSIFYWPEGPEVAFCYSNHLPETVVDIIPIGMLESGAEHLKNYEGEILIQQPDRGPAQTEPVKPQGMNP